MSRRLFLLGLPYVDIIYGKWRNITTNYQNIYYRFCISLFHISKTFRLPGKTCNKNFFVKRPNCATAPSRSHVKVHQCLSIHLAFDCFSVGRDVYRVNIAHLELALRVEVQ